MSKIGLLRGGQGSRGEEKDGKHRSRDPSRKRGKKIPPKNRIKETRKHRPKEKKKAQRVEGEAG